ncbi:hypothetical protein H0H92_012545, partial [Tricholoma furcatifolium]
PTDPLEDLPVGALIHALQAVEHSLNEYQTGTQIIDKTPRGFYLADNYGDKELEKKDENGRMFIEKTPNASRYIATFKDFKVKHWKAILDASREHLLNLPTRRGRKSRSSSQSSSVRSLRVEEEETLRSSQILQMRKRGHRQQHRDNQTWTSLLKAIQMIQALVLAAAAAAQAQTRTQTPTNVETPISLTSCTTTGSPKAH